LSVEEFADEAAPLLIARGMASNYALGRVWVDTVGGASGTTPFENGTVHAPVDSIDDAYTIGAASTVKINAFNIANGSAITLPASSSAKSLSGNGWTLDLNGRDISGSRYSGAKFVTGTGSGTLPVFDRCAFDDVTLPPTVIASSSFGGTFSASGAGQFLIVDGVAAAEDSNPIFDFSGVSGATEIDIRNWTGSIDIEVGEGVSVTIDAISGGTVTLSGDGGMAGATVHIRGHVESVVDITGSNVTVNQDGRE
jgi:hypothetical protein